MSETLKEGWVWFYNASKWHYIVEGRSLCGRWGYFGSEFEQGKDNHPDNCAGCVKKLEKRKAKQAEQ